MVRFGAACGAVPSTAQPTAVLASTARITEGVRRFMAREYNATVRVQGVQEVQEVQGVQEVQAGARCRPCDRPAAPYRQQREGGCGGRRRELGATGCTLCHSFDGGWAV